MQQQDLPLILTDPVVAHEADGPHLEALPVPEPQHPLRLATGSDLDRRLWCVALDDVERNIVTTGNDRLFKDTIGLRELALSGLLGVNRLYPEIMLATLKAIEAPAREDDAAWIGCAEDLLRQGTDNYEWQWLYTTGRRWLKQWPDASNVFRLRALQSMARVADLLGRFADARDWRARADALKTALGAELAGGTASGIRRNELALAIAMLDGLVPVEPLDVSGDNVTPLVATLRLSAFERAEGKDRTAVNMQRLARAVDEEGFHCAPGAAHDLCTAAAFINVCLRAGLLSSGPSTTGWGRSYAEACR